jgi:hypothetical protein
MNKPLSRVPGRPLAIALAAAVALSGVTGCENRGNERWVVTEDTRVEIDWDAVNTAYREAEGPEDFERRVNEIYAGDEVVSVSVRDENDKTQVVTGFFDHDGDGSVGESEKVFTIKRDITGEGAAQYQIAGHGAYGHYHSPMWDIAAGMMLGSFLSNMFMPGYRPMYMVPYSTSPARRGALMSHRDSYRAANPSKFPPKSSTSGRSYGNRGSQWGSGGSGTRSGGGRRGGGFGTGAGRSRVVVRA